MKNFDLKKVATELGYLNESIGVNLKDLTFNTVVRAFNDQYKNIQFTRKQPSGEEGPYYRDAVSFPNANDSLTTVADEGSFEKWKDKTLSKYGNVQINLAPEADNWFDKVKIVDDKFKKDKSGFMKGKQSFIDKERKSGRSID
jgi:hypothetical protein|tara:strand:- start:1074 stop:1502 length:429 start_codon:yes stop_codon:yes gene_type:complete